VKNKRLMAVLGLVFLTQQAFSLDQNQILGVWECELDGSKIEIALDSDGTFTNTTTRAGKTDVFRGTYSVEGNQIVVRSPVGTPVVWSAARNGDSLSLSTGNHSVSLVKKQ
jgi:hypothetical protein